MQKFKKFKIMQGAKLFIQGAKLSLVQNYTRCKIMQGAKLYMVQNYERCKNVQGAKSCKVQNCATCKGKTCNVKNKHLNIIEYAFF